MIYFITYVLLALGVSLFSFGKRISYFEVFFISLLLTPIIGLIITMKAENNIRTHRYTTTYTCTVCNRDSTENEKLCPTCGNEMESSYIKDTKLSIA